MQLKFSNEIYKWIAEQIAMGLEAKTYLKLVQEISEWIIEKSSKGIKVGIPKESHKKS